MSVLMKSIVLSPSYKILAEDVIFEQDDLIDSILLQNKILYATKLDSTVVDYYDRLDYNARTEFITFRRNKNVIHSTNVIQEQHKQDRPPGLNKYQISKTHIHINTKSFTDLMIFFYPFVFWYDLFGKSKYNYTCLVQNISPYNYIVEVLCKTPKFNLDRLYDNMCEYSKAYEETTTT